MCPQLNMSHWSPKVTSMLKHLVRRRRTHLVPHTGHIYLSSNATQRVSKPLRDASDAPSLNFRCIHVTKSREMPCLSNALTLEHQTHWWPTGARVVLPTLPRTQTPASDAIDSASDEKQSCDFTSGEVKSRQFISKKTLNPASQTRREGERIPNHSVALKFHLLCKCANTTKCIPPCVYVLLFSKIFFQRS